MVATRELNDKRILYTSFGQIRADKRQSTLGESGGEQTEMSFAARAENIHTRARRLQAGTLDAR